LCRSPPCTPLQSMLFRKVWDRRSAHRWPAVQCLKQRWSASGCREVKCPGMYHRVSSRMADRRASTRKLGGRRDQHLRIRRPLRHDERRAQSLARVYSQRRQRAARQHRRQAALRQQRAPAQA